MAASSEQGVTQNNTVRIDILGVIKVKPSVIIQTSTTQANFAKVQSSQSEQDVSKRNDTGNLKIYLICQTLGLELAQALSNLSIDSSLDPSTADCDPWGWALSQAQANVTQELSISDCDPWGWALSQTEANLTQCSLDSEDILLQGSSHIDSTPSSPLSQESMSTKGPHSDDYELTEPSIHLKVEGNEMEVDPTEDEQYKIGETIQYIHRFTVVVLTYRIF
jgi:hypothetical protein